VGFLVILI